MTISLRVNLPRFSLVVRQEDVSLSRGFCICLGSRSDVAVVSNGRLLCAREGKEARVWRGWGMASLGKS